MAKRTKSSGLDGIINLDKPAGISSAKALYRVRAITGQRKGGHAGTLDPGATGVLVLCLGKATKLVESIMDQPKVYRATARIDVTSESFDLDRPLIPIEVAEIPSSQAVQRACASFEGLIQQVPPTISAIKIDGQPAYQRVRHNETVTMQPRAVRVYWVHLHSYAWPNLDFEMCCGRGTYVRALIRDLGEHLGAGGCLTSLVRRRVGPFALDRAWSLESLGAADGPESYLVDLDRARMLLDPAAIHVPARPDAARTDTGQPEQCLGPEMQ